METDQRSLHEMATDQQTQQMLQQQMLIQGGVMPQAPTPTAKVKRAGTGGLTKRASLWNWPTIFGRGKNGKNGNKKKPQHNGPPPPQASRRGGPPNKNKPPGKHGGPPPRRGERRGPPPPQHKQGPNNRPPDPESFMKPMKNPFAHLQDNFIGKHASQEARRIQNFQHGQDQINRKFADGRNQFPMQQGPMQGQQNVFQQNRRFSGENTGQLPQQLMMPPASPGLPLQLPQFKKIPNNKKPMNRNDEYVDLPSREQQGMERPTQAANPPTPAVDRMMLDADDPLQSPIQPPTDYFAGSNSQASPEQQFNDYEADPAGLKMLKQTENFGHIYHLINPDGSPVNMQFEKQPIVPPVVQFSSQPQQDLVEDLASVLPHPNTAENLAGGDELLDASLATAVYDPNVFPDIYFTTTEKHNNIKPHQIDLLENHNMFGGSLTLSQEQELLHNPLLGNNQIKRILGIVSSEKTGSAGSGEGGSSGANKIALSRKKAGAVLRSNEVSDDGEQVAKPRRKMRRRKKNRMNQQQLGNQVDASEPELTGADASAVPANTVLPKRRRKGRRKKKYRLHTMSPQNDQDGGMASSTERMGLAGGGEQASAEMKTETPTPDPLTTTPANVVIVTPTSPVSSAGEGKESKIKVKTSFTLPSSEDVRPTSSLEQLLLTGPSSENKIDTSSAGASSVTSTKRASEETTTNVPMSFSTFGYYDALRNKQKSENQEDDYDFSGPSGYFRQAYDPRFPPDHEVNRSHNMSKFIRPRVPGQGPSTPSSTDVTNGPFILYDMTGTRNQSRFSSKFHQETSPFKLDGDLHTKNIEPNRQGDPYGKNPHPFTTNFHKSGQSSGDQGLYLKFDSREWANDRKTAHNQQDHSSDPFSKHYNKTSLTSGYYGSVGSKEFRPSVEIPWDKGYNTPSTTTPSPAYPNYSLEINKNKFGNGARDHNMFGGPTMETFGLPKSSTPISSSGEKTQRKLHKNIFGGSSADVSDDLGNWASPNFWGATLQEAGRYSPNGDFEANRKNDLNRLIQEFGDPNGLKEMKPVDLSSPTPLPMPAPSAQSTMEDMMDDGPNYFLPPSTPGERWGKQRKRKQKTTVAPTTPSSIPFVRSTVPTTPVSFQSSSSAAPTPKWLAVMSNELDLPSEYYDNLSMLPPGSGSLELDLKRKKGKKKSGVEIKFKSGEERDPEEEEEQQRQQNESVNMTAAAGYPQFNVLNGNPSGASGYPGVMVHNFESDSGYGFGETGSGKNNNLQLPPPPPPGFPHVHIPPDATSDISYFPIVNSDNRGGNGPVSSVPSVNPPMAQFGHPPLTHIDNNRKPTQGPIFPGRPNNNNNNNNNGRRDFVPSSEDLGPLPPLPPLPQSATGSSGSGLPSHKENPFTLFEKQNTPVNSGMGFVSTKHELQEMQNQISKFSTIPETFLRRDSSEKMDGGDRVHAPNLGKPCYFYILYPS